MRQAQINAAVLDATPDPIGLFAADGALVVENTPMATLRDGGSVDATGPDPQREVRDELVAANRTLSALRRPRQRRQGTLMGRIVVLRDVTAAREGRPREGRVLRARLARAAHPLTSIIGYLEPRDDDNQRAVGGVQALPGGGRAQRQAPAAPRRGHAVRRPGRGWLTRAQPGRPRPDRVRERRGRAPQRRAGACRPYARGRACARAGGRSRPHRPDARQPDLQRREVHPERGQVVVRIACRRRLPAGPSGRASRPRQQCGAAPGSVAVGSDLASENLLEWWSGLDR